MPYVFDISCWILLANHTKCTTFEKWVFLLKIDFLKTTFHNLLRTFFTTTCQQGAFKRYHVAMLFKKDIKIKWNYFLSFVASLQKWRNRPYQSNYFEFTGAFKTISNIYHGVVLVNIVNYYKPFTILAKVLHLRCLTGS